MVHRDIKPGNVLLSERGEPLVADFGIALAVAQAGGGRITETGLSLGTPHYMSPEQATGDRDVDARSDVYALGCVLYEMLSGRPPFSASTAQGVLVQILTTDPRRLRVYAGRYRYMSRVCWVVRWRSCRGIASRVLLSSRGRWMTRRSCMHLVRWLRIRGVLLSGSGPVQEVAVPKKGRDFSSSHPVGVAAVMTAIAAWGWLQPAPEPEAEVPTRTRITDFDVSRGGGWRLAISRDGRSIVATHSEGGISSLYIRPSDDTEWRELSNTQGGSNPGFSPDGQWVHFDLTGSGLFKVPISGGPALPIVSPGSSGHWASNDTVVYSNGGALYRVGAAGGEPEMLLDLDSVRIARPHMLPNGRGIIFGTNTGGSPLNSRVMLLEIETGELRELIPSGNQPRYALTGHVIYGHGDQALMGIPFDSEALAATGTPVTLLPSLSVFTGGASQFAVSETGTLIYDAGEAGETAITRGRGSTLIEVDFQGAERPLPLSPGALDVPRYSPDGAKIAYEDGSEIRIYDVSTGPSPQFTRGGASSLSGLRMGSTCFSQNRRHVGGFWIPSSIGRSRGSCSGL
ncbi:MAG: hypothetical protein Ct9H300mP15_28080 [Gemmatimonadota bacterium]|nr:MAG: hypothetical protein Ct9H300mP15_28080 [Gemmatimonadota bacterium]